MKKILVICGALTLAGCTADAQWAKISMAVGTLDNDLAKLSQGSIPKACKIIGVADSYFQDLKDNISAKNITIETKAMSAVNVICNNPPSSVVAALKTLWQLWLTVQNATKA